MSIPSMSDIDLSGKRVLIRQDLNVPVKDGKVTSDARIKASLPTIKAALDAGAAVMVDPRVVRVLYIPTVYCTAVRVHRSS